MPIIKSAKKRALQNEKRRLINLARKTAVKTCVKKVLTAMENQAAADIVAQLFRDAESKISRAKKKVYHSNTAARKVSRLAKRVAEYSKAANA